MSEITPRPGIQPDLRSTMSVEDELIRSRDSTITLDELLAEMARPSFQRTVIEGSQRSYTMADMRQLVVDVRAGKGDIAEIPRTDGWRQKVYSLLVAEQPQKFLDAEEG